MCCSFDYEHNGIVIRVGTSSSIAPLERERSMYSQYQAVDQRDPLINKRGGQTHAAPASSSVQPMRMESSSPKCNDWLFALLFVMHLATIGYFAVSPSVFA
jgi:hypothetical protein